MEHDYGGNMSPCKITTNKEEKERSVSKALQRIMSLLYKEVCEFPQWCIGITQDNKSI